MSKLLERLQDPARSGTYRVRTPAAVLDAVRAGAPALTRIALPEGKEALLGAIAHALDFPEWFGRNWDALEDCLADLSWRGGAGEVLLFERFTPGDDLGVLIDVLASAAEHWASRGRPFFAVFVDPARALNLPDLHREP